MANPQLQKFLDGMYQLAKTCIRFTRKRAFPLLVSAVIVSSAMIGWKWYRDWMTIDLALLVGPAGSTGFVDAREIATEIERANSLLGKEFNVRLETTQGYEENRERVSEDISGTTIGFAHDGFGEAQRVRILLPLDRVYLHILCRADFLTTATTRSPPPPSSVTLSTIVDQVKPGRVFLGPQHSGTRQLASIVLEHFDADPEKLATNGVANWNEMRAALNNGLIDIGFYCGPRDATVLRKIADDGQSRLIGIDGNQEAITQGRVNIFKAELAANSYKNGGFCPTKVETIGSRRVIVCSDQMSDHDAYFLAVQASQALSHKYPDISWGKLPPEKPSSDAGLTYQLHPGVEVLSQGRTEPPAWFPFRWTWLWGTVGLWLATEAVQLLNRRLSDKSSSQMHASLKSEVEDAIRDLEQEPLTITPERYNECRDRMSKMRDAVLSARRDRSIDFDQARSLLVGIRREFGFELEIRKPQEKLGKKVATGPKRRSKGAKKGVAKTSTD